MDLQLVTFITVFSASGLVPLFDLLFPAFTSAYLLLLSRLSFPEHGGATTNCKKILFDTTSRLFRVYMILGAVVGLLLPLAYVLGGFVRGDEDVVRWVTPHLFLLSFQVLTENVVSGLCLFSPPVRVLVPMLCTVRRIFVILGWIRDSWLNKTLPLNADFKLLDWMHRKFRNGEAPKEFSTGNPCNCLMGQPPLDDIEYYPKSNYFAKPSNKSRENHLRKSFACLDTARADNEHMEEESSDAFSELFHGFLAIGTFGTDPITGDPATPTFSTSVEYIMEKETEATENELQFFNDELEKVLSTEGKEDDSSGRNSYVSNGRSSYGSTITLSGKPLEAAENEYSTVACPLQGYLFNSAIGLPETTTGKKEQRTSLRELFQKTKLAEENTGNKFKSVEKQKEKETDKSAVHLMKKILKGRKSSGGTTDTASADKKMHKILHMFHRKVHPESTTKCQNRSKYVMNSTSANEEGYKKRNQMLSGEDITIFPETDVSKKSAKNTKGNMPQATCGASDSNGNRECWIKSDADYLVLEL